MKAEHYAALALLVGRLSRLLKLVGDQAPGFAGANSQASILGETVKALQENGPAFAGPAGASRLKSIARGLIGIGRLVDGDFSWSAHGTEINEALHDVVLWAWRIAKSPN